MSILPEIQRLAELPVDDLEYEVLSEILEGSGESFSGSLNDELQKLRGALQKKILDHLERNKAYVFEKICMEGKWCEIVKNKKVDMVIWLIDIGFIAAIGVPVAPVRLAVYVVRLGFLDKLCGCT